MKYLKFWKWLSPQWYADTFGWNRNANPAPEFIVIALWIFIVLRVGFGLAGANSSDKCVVYSVADVVIAPFYAVGCQLAKKRFNYRLN